MDIYIQRIAKTNRSYTKNKMYQVNRVRGYLTIRNDEGNPYELPSKCLKTLLNKFPNTWKLGITDLSNYKNIRYLGESNTYFTKNSIYSIIDSNIYGKEGYLSVLDNTKNKDDLYALPVNFYTGEINGTNTDWVLQQEGNKDLAIPTTEEAIGSSIKSTNQKANIMGNIQITNPTLINGTDVKTLSNQELLDAIINEESRIESLNSITADSKKIKKMIKEHETNIGKLVKILDARK